MEVNNMYIYLDQIILGSDLKSAMVVVVMAITLACMVTAILGLTSYILVALKAIEEYIKNRDEK